MKERCIGLHVPKGSNYTSDFVISGEGEYNVLTRVMTPSGFVLYQSPKRTREGHFSAISNEEGQYRMCFRGLDRRPKAVSVAVAQKEELRLMEFGEDVRAFELLATDMRGHLDSVIQNIRFTREQELLHCDLATATSSLVLWTALGKLLLLAFVSFLQVYLLVYLLNRSGLSSV